MRIGIVTFHRASNYGAVLQAYALQTVLQKLGHEPFFLETGFRRKTGLRAYIGKTPPRTLNKLLARRKQMAFDAFTQHHLSLRMCDESNDILVSHAECDALICGSDQIWNPHYLKSLRDERVFFLDFGRPSIRRIAYAVSLGVNEMDPIYKNRMIDYINRMDYISVRECFSVDLVSQLTSKPVEWVPDPTLLLKRDDYERAFLATNNHDEEVFQFMIGQSLNRSEMRFANSIVAQKLNNTIQCIDNNHVRLVFNGAYTPIEWLQMLSNSAFVLTDSFHATVFAILFHRPFVVFPIEGRMAGMNTRITSLLSLIGLESKFVRHITRSNIEQAIDEPIYWNSVDDKLTAFAAKGISFLNAALSEL